MTAAAAMEPTELEELIEAQAEAALAEVFATKLKEGSEAQAAIVVMSADGAVRAMVGGRKTQGAGSFNRATQAQLHDSLDAGAWISRALRDSIASIPIIWAI